MDNITREKIVSFDATYLLNKTTNESVLFFFYLLYIYIISFNFLCLFFDWPFDNGILYNVIFLALAFVLEIPITISARVS